MPATVIPFLETAREHMQRTRHRYFTWRLEADLKFIRAVLGRDPREDDRYVGILVCDTCSLAVLNGDQ